jgi:hypothetical protein
MSSSSLEMDHLLKLRLVVARVGEMDIAKWWNTKGQLGRLGAVALRRGFPRTYYFAQARSTFAVAAQRCAEVFDPPNSVNLWRLTDLIEEDFASHWEHWLDDAANWSAFFQKVEKLDSPDLLLNLQHLKLIDQTDIEAFRKLKRQAEGRAVPISRAFSGSSTDINLLAVGFARGEVGALAVPYAPEVSA